MNKNRTTYYRIMFISAAFFNWAVGMILIFSHNTFFQLLDMTPVKDSLFVHLFALLVLMFGLGYYWISLNPMRERSLIVLGCIAKFLVFITFVVYFFYGYVSWKLLTLVTGDLIYSLIFFECLMFQGRAFRFSKDILSK